MGTIAVPNPAGKPDLLLNIEHSGIKHGMVGR